MSNRAIFQNDMPVAKVLGVSGQAIPDGLQQVPFERLRWIDGGMVDAADYALFYLDEQGRKHIADGDGYQELACGFDDELVAKDGTWHVKSDAEKLSAAKATAKQALQKSFTTARAQVAANADRYKLAGWVEKASRARRVAANAASPDDIATLEIECTKRNQGETYQELAQKQLEKAARLGNAVATLDGLEAVALETIDAKRTLNTVTQALTKLTAALEATTTTLLNGGD